MYNKSKIQNLERTWLTEEHQISKQDLIKINQYFFYYNKYWLFLYKKKHFQTITICNNF